MVQFQPSQYHYLSHPDGPYTKSGDIRTCKTWSEAVQFHRECALGWSGIADRINYETSCTGRFLEACSHELQIWRHSKRMSETCSESD